MLQSQPPQGDSKGSVSSLWTRMASSIGPTWILVGMLTWSVLNWQAQYWLHTPAALDMMREQVPMQVYDRSTFLFLTALVMDVLNILFERQTTKLDYVLLPAFVKGMATTSNMVVRFGTPTVAFTTLGRPFMVQRYVCWAHTTPTLLMLVRLISSSISDTQFFTAVAWDETMLLTGVLALVTTGWLQVVFAILTHVALLPIIPYLYKGFNEAIEEVTSKSTRRLMWVIFGLNVLLWTMFGVTWDLAFLGLVTSHQEEYLYLICDFSAKVLFSSTLMLSSFKSMEGRRETAMRHIEEGSKQKLIEELRHLLEQKERFMSSVSHELRTPLNGIIGISEGMLSGCCGVLPEQTRRQIYIIRTSGARLLALINDVMDASALKQNKLVLKQEQIVLRHAVDDVLDLTRSLVDHEVELRNTIPPRITVQGDTGRLMQVLNNLLGNAAKFTRRGFIKVSARTFDSGARVAITVQDTGIGVPQSKLAHIFLPFEQVDMSISRKYGGFGLGLNIVQELVKAHGGEIWVESTEGKGSTFTFTMMSGQPKTSMDGESLLSDTSLTFAEHNEWSSNRHRGQRQLPMGSGGTGTLERSAVFRSVVEEGQQSRDSEALGMEAMEEQTAAGFGELQYNAAELSALASSKPYAARPEPSPPGSVMQNSMRPQYHTVNDSYQIMSVDDDMVNQSVINTLLSSTGYEVISFPGGPEALAHIERCSVLPDLVLLDCMMPGMDGYEVLQRLRGMLPHTHVPVIMVSARSEEENIVLGLETGADDYVTKPFRRAEFLARVRGQLGVAEQEDLEFETTAAHSQLRRMGGSNINGEAHEASVRAGSQATPPPAAAPRHNYVVLAVDDDEINQMILQGMLRSQNMRYLKAKSGEEGLAQLVADPLHPPDLVVLDASLPDMSGFEVCKRVRALYSKTEVPIIMLSARHNEQAVVEGLLCGANDYVTKPFKRNELMARIRMHLRHVMSGTDTTTSSPPSATGPAPDPPGLKSTPASPPATITSRTGPRTMSSSSPPQPHLPPAPAAAGAAAASLLLPTLAATAATDSRSGSTGAAANPARLQLDQTGKPQQAMPTGDAQDWASTQGPQSHVQEDPALLSTFIDASSRLSPTRSPSQPCISTACSRALAGFSYAPALAHPPRGSSPGSTRQSVSLNSHLHARRIAGFDNTEAQSVSLGGRVDAESLQRDLAPADGIALVPSSAPGPILTSHPDLGSFGVATSATTGSHHRPPGPGPALGLDPTAASGFSSVDNAAPNALNSVPRVLNRAGSTQGGVLVLPAAPSADLAISPSASLLPWSTPPSGPAPHGLQGPPHATLSKQLARQATSAVSSNHSNSTITSSQAPTLRAAAPPRGVAAASAQPQPQSSSLSSAQLSRPGWSTAAGAGAGAGGGGAQGVVPGAKGVLVGRVSDYRSLCRLVPSSELLAAVQQLVQLFTRTTASLGLTLLHCDGELFTATLPTPSTTATGGSGAAGGAGQGGARLVSLLQLAQALLDAAGSHLLPSTGQPLLLQLLLHVPASPGPDPSLAPPASHNHQPPQPPNRTAHALTEAMGQVVAEAQAWLPACPLLAIAASHAATVGLVAAGMAPPQQLVWVGSQPLSVLEVHANAALLRPTPAPALDPASPSPHMTLADSNPGPDPLQQQGREWAQHPLPLGQSAPGPGDAAQHPAPPSTTRHQPAGQGQQVGHGHGQQVMGWAAEEEEGEERHTHTAAVDGGENSGVSIGASASTAGDLQLAAMRKELDAMRQQLQQLAVQGVLQANASEPGQTRRSPGQNNSPGGLAEPANSVQRWRLLAAADVAETSQEGRVASGPRSPGAVIPDGTCDVMSSCDVNTRMLGWSSLLPRRGVEGKTSATPF